MEIKEAHSVYYELSNGGCGTGGVKTEYRGIPAIMADG